MHLLMKGVTANVLHKGISVSREISNIFLPWRGEFGQMLMTHVRWVNHQIKDGENNIVCCRHGDEALFPRASGYFYEWLDPQDYRKDTDLLQSEDNREYLQTIENYLRLRYHNVVTEETKFLVPIEGKKPQRFHADPSWAFKPQPLWAKGDHLSPDVVIGPRFRKHGDHRNYPHWQTIVDLCEDAGLTVGLVGMRGTSVNCQLKVDEYKSWYYDSLDTTLDWMNKARLTITSDCGIAHLAVLNQTPLAVLYEEKGKEAGHPKWPWVYPHMKKHAKAPVHPILTAYSNPDGAWQQLKAILY